MHLPTTVKSHLETLKQKSIEKQSDLNQVITQNLKSLLLLLIMTSEK